MNVSQNHRSSLWISNPTNDELKVVRSIVNVPTVISAWIHTGDEMQLEPCNFRLVLEVDSATSNSAQISYEVIQRAERLGTTVNVWCIPAGKVDQFPWLIEKSVRVV